MNAVKSVACVLAIALLCTSCSRSQSIDDLAGTWRIVDATGEMVQPTEEKIDENKLRFYIEGNRLTLFVADNPQPLTCQVYADFT